jgi:drug/metabolite transporter (DMT)-like permease
MSKTTARLYVLAAVLLWSSSSFFTKSHFFDDWPIEWRGAMFGFWRAVAATCVLLPAVRRVRFRPMLIPMVLSFAGMNITFLSAMVQTTAANAIWLESTAPFWVLLASVLIFRERLRKREFVPFIAAFLGVGLILAFELTHAEGTSRMGVIWGILSGVCYGGVLVTIRQLREENHVWLVALNHAAAALVLAPLVLGLGYWPTLFQLLWLTAFGVIQMALPYLLLTIGLRTIASHEAALIGLVEPILNPIWALLIWGEHPAWWTLAGAGFILIGLGLRYLVWESPPSDDHSVESLGQTGR